MLKISGFRWAVFAFCILSIPDMQAAEMLQSGLNPDPVKLRLPKEASLSAVARLGRTLFFETRLSSSGKLACASCHKPDHAYGPSGKGSVMAGGPALRGYGIRAVPSLRYLYRQPAFSIGPYDSGDNDSPPSLEAQASQAMNHARLPKSAGKPDESAGNLVPRGGLFWDGRADTLQQQASGPLFNPDEMDAGSPATVAEKIRKFDYAKRFKLLFGPNIFEDPKQVVAEAMFAISRFQIEDKSFHPFSSKYDAWLEGKARFTPAETRGYLAFNDPERGNCGACHLSRPTRDGLPPLFTDFQYEALGLPRNPAIPANHDPQFHDMGICGPVRTDMKKENRYCGMFRTPSLRNVAVRRVFFHNGIFHSLKDALDWYVDRDLHPERFYPRDESGKVEKFDDLPEEFRTNVDRSDAPFNRHPGDRPSLNREEMKDIISFLNTLTDGYRERSGQRCAHPRGQAGEGGL